jgi:hypothetical protein
METVHEGFPRELLEQPKEARLAYFRAKVIAHPRLKEVHLALMNAIQQPTGVLLILVLGPTGVGKTTLRLRVEKQLWEEACLELEQDLGRVPVVGVEAVAPESGNFNWKDYYSRVLLALDEPLIRYKIDYGTRGLRRNGAGQLVVGHDVAAVQLRRTVELSLRHRRPSAVIVDEAQHMKKVSGSRRMLDQMDTLKSLASTTGIVHVLVGTYELLGLANLSAQLSRRSIEIHFPRYRPDHAEDVVAFKRVLLTFQRHLPLVEEPDLVGRYDYFYERSAGCVGILKKWLDRTLAFALEEGRATLTTADLERHAAQTRKLLRMAWEIKEGEEALQARGQGRMELRTLLGLEAQSQEPGRANGSGSLPPDATSPKRPAGRVGQRRPARDPVGQGENGM